MSAPRRMTDAGMSERAAFCIAWLMVCRPSTVCCVLRRGNRFARARWPVPRLLRRGLRLALLCRPALRAPRSLPQAHRIDPLLSAVSRGLAVRARLGSDYVTKVGSVQKGCKTQTLGQGSRTSHQSGRSLGSPEQTKYDERDHQAPHDERPFDRLLRAQAAKPECPRPDRRETARALDAPERCADDAAAATPSAALVAR